MCVSGAQTDRFEPQTRTQVGWSDCGEDGAGYLAERQPAPVQSRCARPQHDRVAVLEEGERAAAGQCQRLAAAPGQLEQRAALVALGAGDRAGGEQVAGAQRGAVDGQVGQLLARASSTSRRTAAGRRRSPLSSTSSARSSAHGSGSSRGRRSGGGSCAGGRHAGRGQRGQRASPRPRSRSRTTCRGTGPSGWYSHAWMSRADQSLSSTTPNTCSAKRRRRHRSPERGRGADDEADLGLDVEAAARAEVRLGVRARPALAARADDRGAGHHDRAGAAVVADRQVLPVGRQRSARPGGRSRRRSWRAARRSRSRRSRRPRRQQRRHLGERVQVRRDAVAWPSSVSSSVTRSRGPPPTPRGPRARNVFSAGSAKSRAVRHRRPTPTGRAPGRRSRTPHARRGAGRCERRRTGRWSTPNAGPAGTVDPGRGRVAGHGSAPPSGRARPGRRPGRDAAAAERDERAAYGRPRRRRRARRAARRGAARPAAAPSRPRRRRRPRRLTAASTLRKPCCSSPSAVVDADRVVQPGGELERQPRSSARAQERGQLVLRRDGLRRSARRCGTWPARRRPPRARRARPHTRSVGISTYVGHGQGQRGRAAPGSAAAGSWPEGRAISAWTSRARSSWSSSAQAQPLEQTRQPGVRVGHQPDGEIVARPGRGQQLAGPGSARTSNGPTASPYQAVRWRAVRGDGVRDASRRRAGRPRRRRQAADEAGQDGAQALRRGR